MNDKKNYLEQGMHATTVIAVRRNGKVAVGSDGQVTLGNTIIKHTAKKVRRIEIPNSSHSILVGFAGSTADAFALFDRLEVKIKEYKDDLRRAAVELAKDWRTDKVLRRLEAMMIVCNTDTMLMISGIGDVIEPEYDTLAIGSGGSFAYSVSRALLENTELEARDIVKKSLEIASDVCIYTNNSINIEEIR